MKKQHYYMVAGEIIFTIGEDVNAVNINSVVTSKAKVIPARGIARAQQAIHGQFLSNMEVTPTLVVRNIVILNMMYLGEMTEEEFNTPPEGMTAQEMEQAKTDFEGAIKSAPSNTTVN